VLLSSAFTSRTHPLLDGNKRLGVVAAFVIFTVNDYRYVGTDNDADFYVSIAAENLALEEIAAHLRTLWLLVRPVSWSRCRWMTIRFELPVMGQCPAASRLPFRHCAPIGSKDGL
jgi:hypothetical protein